MTIYNFGHYASGATPDAALAAMFSAMNPSSQGAVGALAFIPQKTFAVHSQSSGFSVPEQCNIMASTGIVFFPSPYDVFSFNVVPSMFVWIGK